MNNASDKTVTINAPVTVTVIDEWTFKQRLLSRGMSPERVEEILCKARALREALQ